MKTDNIKRFAVQARNNIIAQVSDALIRLGYNQATSSFNEEPVAAEGGYIFKGNLHNDSSRTFLNQWKSLKDELVNHKVEDVIEEVAYTWFNRVMAIKILGENGYIDPILDPLSEKISTPILISKAKNGELPKLSVTEQSHFDVLILDETKESELFSLLFVAYCRNYPLISRIFGTIDDYKQLLIPDLLGPNGLVTQLQQTDAITTEDYQQVELIGWLYQFYISEKKAEVFAGFKKNKKADANTIPAATQIFTPNWIVKYIVENTVGQVWLDANADSDIVSDMPYYIKPDESYIPTPIIGEAKDLKLLDPACGSGHILVEGLSLLLKCYEEEFYEPKEAARAILKHNIFGLDIDLRAAQLARFAVLLMAAKTDADILVEDILPNIYEMPEPESFSKEELGYFLGLDLEAADAKAEPCLMELYDALELMQEAKLLGSIMKFDLSKNTISKIQERVIYWQSNHSVNALYYDINDRLKPFLDVLFVMTQKYEAVVANPPYMGSSNFNNELKKYTTKKYKESKADLYAIFMQVSLNLLSSNAFLGMINQNNWMFLSSFESFRKTIINNTSIISLLHLGTRAFPEIGGEVVQNASFILKSSLPKGKGLYINLKDFNSSSEKDIKYIEAINNRECSWFFTTNQEEFAKIPGSPIAYWLSDKMLDVFEKNETLAEIGDAKWGLKTGDNNRFLRLWPEVSIQKTCFNAQNSEAALSTGKKWFPCNKGGSRRKWFGNHDYMVNWENDGSEIKHCSDEKGKITSGVPNLSFYFRKAISWGLITSGGNSFRYYPDGFIFDQSGVCYFPIDQLDHSYILGLLNTSIYVQISKIINPTLNLSNGDFAKFPAPPELDPELKENIKQTVERCIAISKQDWDAHETSWYFEENEFLRINKAMKAVEATVAEDGVAIEGSENPNKLASLYQAYCKEWRHTFMALKSNEEEINKIFIDHYDMADEISYQVPLKDITILQEGEIKLEDDDLVFQGREVMSQFISYLMGCFMGRYRLDKPGLHIAYPEATSDDIAPYQYNGEAFEIDDDGIVPLMPGDVSFQDNALIRIKKALSIIFGAEHQVENLNFIENQLGQTLEDYLVKDFYKDHCQRYKKRPIYWLFSSPKGAFKVLVYMHRLNAYTIDNIRQQYLLPHIGNLTSRIDVLTQEVDGMSAKENKAFNAMKVNLQECLTYNDVLKEVAEAKIEIDLDDGVVVNYAKYKAVVAKIK